MVIGLPNTKINFFSLYITQSVIFCYRNRKWTKIVCYLKTEDLSIKVYVINIPTIDYRTLNTKVEIHETPIRFLHRIILKHLVKSHMDLS